MNSAQTLDLAVQQHRAGNLRAAEQLYRQILQAEPRHADALHLLGVIARQLGRHDLAIEYMQTALRERPAFAQAYYNLGNTLQDQGKLDEAIGNYRQAIGLKPDYAEAHNCLGTACYERGLLDEAAVSFRESLRLKPDTADAHNNLGSVHYEQGELDEAAASYERALLLKPEQGNFHFNRAVLWLLQGRFEKGWAEYEWRWRSTLQSPRPLPQPLWQGEPLAGRTILLHAEQGIGDTLQLVRYIALVRAHGAGRVLLECQPPLTRLLTYSCGILGADRVLAVGEPLPSFDVHAPLFSLPRLLGTTSPERIPAPVPYLRCDPELIGRWRVRLEERRGEGERGRQGDKETGRKASLSPPLPVSLSGFRVGIVWQGNPRNQKDRWRSVPLERFAPLGEVPGVSLISLQKDEQSPNRMYRTVAGFRGGLLELGTELTDFADTAAVLQSLDLVITVDTALAHLAEALGIAAWLALPLTPDWRWLLGREDSPWYPTLRLFRQERPGDWDGVFSRIREALADVAGGR